MQTKNIKKHKKQKQVLPMAKERLDRGNVSELVGFCFWGLLGRPAKTKKTIQTHGEGLRRGWTGDIGLNCLFCYELFYSANACISLPSQKRMCLQASHSTPHEYPSDKYI